MVWSEGKLNRRTPNCSEANYHEDLQFWLILNKAATQSAARVFPNTIMKGYCFHLSQSIWRHAQKAGLAVCYGEDRVWFPHVPMWFLRKRRTSLLLLINLKLYYFRKLKESSCRLKKPMSMENVLPDQIQPLFPPMHWSAYTLLPWTRSHPEYRWCVALQYHF